MSLPSPTLFFISLMDWLWLQGPHSCACPLYVPPAPPVTCLMHIHTVYSAHTSLAGRLSASTFVL